MRYLCFFILILSLPTFSAEHGGAVGVIKSITIKETGYVLIVLESSHANTMECEKSTYIAIAQNNPNKNQMLSLALAALAGGNQVSFWVTGCYEYYGTSYPLATTSSIYK